MPTSTGSTDFTQDVRNHPAYTVAEASRYLKLPAATLRSWVAGRSFPRAGGIGHSRPLIVPAKPQPLALSFYNLIEAHVLRSLRTDHAVSLKALRDALEYAQGELGVERLLLDRRLATEGGQLFLERYGELIHLSASGQLAMRKVFEDHLRRVERDDWQFPVRLLPFLTSTGAPDDRPIAIEASLAFGRPVLRRRGISTEIIAQRLDAGETVAQLADDYDLTEREIEQAVIYERAA